MLDAIWFIFVYTKKKRDSGRVTEENCSGTGDTVSGQEDQPQATVVWPLLSQLKSKDLRWELSQGLQKGTAVCIGTALICYLSCCYLSQKVS